MAREKRCLREAIDKQSPNAAKKRRKELEEGKK